MKYDAFISFDPQNRAQAEKVTGSLAAEGLTYLSSEHIRPGTDYNKEITRLISQCRALVLIASAAANENETMISEVETAFKLRRMIIPYYLEDAEPGESLRFLTQNIRPIRAYESDRAPEDLVTALKAAPKPPVPVKKVLIAAVAAAVVIVAGALVFTLLRNPAPTASGATGDCVWSYYEGAKKLVISGEGETGDYFADAGGSIPWRDHAADIETVRVEEGVTDVGSYAFSDMENLKTLSFPGTLDTLGVSVVSGCPALTEVTLAEGLNTIFSGAVSTCPSLEKLEIPASVSYIAGAPCSLCEGLREITVAEGNTHYTSVDGVLYDSAMTELVQYPTGAENTAFTMPDSVETLALAAMFDCEHIGEITFSQNLKTIESMSLSGLSVSEVFLPDSVESIGENAFAFCPNLSSVRLSENLKTIETYAFLSCPELREITIPGSVVYIGDVAMGFGYTDDMEKTYYDLTIIGAKDSPAQKYAEKYYFNFVEN